MRTPSGNDTKEITAIYRLRMAERFAILPFAGVPGKGNPTAPIQAVFVPPMLEREANVFALAEMMLAMQAGNEAVHPRELRKQGGHTGERMPLSDALHTSPCIVLLGEAGAGKTTLLTYLTHCCATGQVEHEPTLADVSGNALLPLFISLRDYAGESATRSLDYSLIHHLYTLANERLYFAPPYKFFEDALEAGQCLVCLDGLDEIWDIGQRKTVADAISVLVSRFPHSRYLVTSRSAGYHQSPLTYTLFEHYTLLPLNDESIHLVITRWYQVDDAVPQAAQAQWATTLWETIEREPQTRTLARSPLLLMLYCLLHGSVTSLPHERVRLYATGMSHMITGWKQAMGVSADEDAHPLYAMLPKLMEFLAYELHNHAEQPGQRQTMTTDMLHRLLTSWVMEQARLIGSEAVGTVGDEQVSSFLTRLQETPGLLREVHPGVVAFAHLAFQEYLTACAIEKQVVNRGIELLWSEIQDHLHTPHWREIILFLMGSLSTMSNLTTEVAKRIMQLGEQDIFEPVLHRHLYLVAGILSTSGNVTAELRQHVVETILHIARTTKWTEQQDAVRVLGRMEGDGYVAMGLLELACDPNVEPVVRLDSATALGKLGHVDEAAQALVTLAHNPQHDLWCARAAAIVLGSLGRKDEAAEALLALAHDPQGSIRERCAAAVALETLGHRDEAVAVLLMLARDPQGDAAVRRNAAETLGRLGHREAAAEVLLDLAGNAAQNAWQRRYAAEALGMLGRRQEAATILLALAQDPSLESRVRRFATESLGTLGYQDEAVFAGLLKLAQDFSRSPWERTTAAMALGKLGRKTDAVGVLMSLAHDTSKGPSVRRAASVALGNLGYPDEAAEVLMALACDSFGDPWERCTAAMAMASLGRTDKAVLDSLLTLAHNPKAQDDERATAAVALGKLGRSEEAAKVLLDLACDTDVAGWVRRTAYDSLKRLVGSRG